MSDTHLEPLYRKAYVGLRAHLKSMGVQARATVYLSLLTRLNHKTGNCFPSIEQIAEDCGISVKTARRAIDWLCVESQLVERIDRPGRTPFYRPREVTVEGRIIGAVSPSQTVVPLPQNGTPPTAWDSHGVGVHPSHRLGVHPSHAVGVEGKEQRGREQEGKEQRGATTSPAAELLTRVGESDGSLTSNTQASAEQDQFTNASYPKASSEQGQSTNASDPQGTVDAVVVKQKPAKAKPAVAKPRMDMAEAEREAVAARACVSASAMAVYLCQGQPGLDALDQGVDPKTLKASTTNWRQFLAFDEAGNVVVGPDGVPNGIEGWTPAAFAGFYWFAVASYADRHNQTVRMPMNLGRLIGTMKNAIANTPRRHLLLRIKGLIDNFDDIMAVKRIYNESPGESTLDNRLVFEAQQQWNGMSEDEKYDVRQSLIARKEAA